MRSMVEGASRATPLFRRKNFVDAGAPPTALRAVPLPAIAGRDEERLATMFTPRNREGDAATIHHSRRISFTIPPAPIFTCLF
jgi:hypothetical protein